MALKKLEAKTETGINYRDYGKEMGETWFAVKGYLESPSANKEPEIAQALAGAMRKYNLAAQLWTWSIESKRDFPKDAVCEKLDYLWKDRKENIEKELPDAIKPRESGGAKFKEYPPGSSPVDCIAYTAALHIAWSNASKELKKVSSFFH